MDICFCVWAIYFVCSILVSFLLDLGWQSFLPRGSGGMAGEEDGVPYNIS